MANPAYHTPPDLISVSHTQDNGLGGETYRLSDGQYSLELMIDHDTKTRRVFMYGPGGTRQIYDNDNLYTQILDDLQSHHPSLQTYTFDSITNNYLVYQARPGTLKDLYLTGQYTSQKDYQVPKVEWRFFHDAPKPRSEKGVSQ